MSRDVYIVVVGYIDGRFCEDSLASSKCLEMCILWLLDLQMVGSVKIAWLPVNVSRCVYCGCWYIDGRFCEDSLASSKCLEMCILWLLDV